MSPERVPSALFKGLPRERGKGGPSGYLILYIEVFLNSNEVAQLRGAVSHRITTGLCAPLLRSLRSLRCSVLALFASLVRMRAIFDDLDSAHRTALRTHSAFRRNVT